MARLSDADQSRLSLSRLNPGGAHRARSCVIARSGEALLRSPRPRHSGVAELLFQVSDDRPGTVSRARLVYSADEAEEHTASPEGRRTDHAPGAGVLRLDS